MFFFPQSLLQNDDVFECNLRLSYEQTKWVLQLIEMTMNSTEQINIYGYKVT